MILSSASISAKSASISEFNLRNSIITKRFGNPLSIFDFYRLVFPEGFLERAGEQRKQGVTGIMTVVPVSRKNPDGTVVKPKAYTRIVTDDLNILSDYNSMNNFLLMSPVAYYGKRPQQKMARWLMGLVFDIDDVYQDNLYNLFRLAYDVKMLPIPTMIVSSGTGLHLYYIFKSPIPMYPYIKEALTAYKEALTRILWTKWTSRNPNLQIHGINQGYRLVGSRTKIGTFKGAEYRVQGWKTGDRIDFNYLDSFLSTENQLASIYKRFTKGKTPLNKAKMLWPDWYQRVIINGEKSSGEWTCKEDLYYWWLRKIQKEGIVGNRYNCMRLMCAYALKSGVSAEEVLKDMQKIYEQFSAMTTIDNPNYLTTEEMLKAYRQYYHPEFKHISIASIEKLTGFSIPKNRRNYRKQAVHLEIARLAQKLKYGDAWRYHGGRPTAEKLVQAFRMAHPYATKAECQRETKISYTTIRKWWDVTNISVSSNEKSTESIKNLSTIDRINAIMEETFSNPNWKDMESKLVELNEDDKIQE